MHEFIYLLLLVVISYLILHKEMVEIFLCLLEYCEFTLTQRLTDFNVLFFWNWTNLVVMPNSTWSISASSPLIVLFDLFFFQNKTKIELCKISEHAAINNKRNHFLINNAFLNYTMLEIEIFYLRMHMQVCVWYWYNLVKEDVLQLG